MIKNVVFDVGNVLVHFRWYEYMLELGIDKETAAFLGENMVLTDFWDRMDLGIEDEDQACKIFTGRFPELKREIELFWGSMERIVRVYDHTEPLIRTLKGQGYGVYLLSNYPPKMYALHWPEFGFRRLTDGEVVSGLEHIAKPDERIFRLLLSRYGLSAEECLFVDDREVNVRAAEALGFKGLVFKNEYGEAVTEIYRKLEEDGNA